MDFRQGQFGSYKTVNKKRQFIPHEPQPDPNNILELHRNYSTLKIDGAYKRRVSWLGKRPDYMQTTSLALVEYTGTYPGRAPHGRAMKNMEEYIRTPAETMDKIGVLTQHGQQPRRVYNTLMRECGVMEEPRNIHQIHAKKYNETKSKALMDRIKILLTKYSRSNHR